ncbi:MAG: hypothetical protein J3K34DRAFT_401018 [Monoraphidium minutum]|nr:MAG: hypothetical protein J3K34DRAFT_401018 [Monoraphidium minutum]
MCGRTQRAAPPPAGAPPKGRRARPVWGWASGGLLLLALGLAVAVVARHLARRVLCVCSGGGVCLFGHLLRLAGGRHVYLALGGLLARGGGLEVKLLPHVCHCAETEGWGLPAGAAG